MKRLVLEIDDEIHQQIKRKALEQKESMREILLELILKWLRWKRV